MHQEQIASVQVRGCTYQGFTARQPAKPEYLLCGGGGGSHALKLSSKENEDDDDDDDDASVVAMIIDDRMSRLRRDWANRDDHGLKYDLTRNTV